MRNVDQRGRRWASALLATWLALSAGAAGAAEPQGKGAWTTTCRDGEDEFATNCEAVFHSGRVRLELGTGDSQLFVQAEADGCPPVDYRNFWRVDVIGLSAARRAALVRRALDEVTRDLAKSCPGLDVASLKVPPPPDIAVR
jgi:hypothetical protein